MEEIKKAFQKVKKDMDFLYTEFQNLKSELSETRGEMIRVCQILKQINKETQKTPKKISPTNNIQKPTLPTNNPTHKTLFKPLKTQNIAISTGNQGASTDRQTDRQTDNKQVFEQKNEEKSGKAENSIDNAARILDSLDSIKKEIRLKFKRLTDQEILVFSTLYQVDEEKGPTDYKTLAKRLNLTESSIRDYIGRLIKKEIPVDKKRINNKMIQLSVSKNLKKIASLPTILQLREI